MTGGEEEGGRKGEGGATEEIWGQLQLDSMLTRKAEGQGEATSQTSKSLWSLIQSRAHQHVQGREYHTRP